MESIVEKFKQWLIEDGKATSTINSYINDVNKFNEYLKEREVDKDVPLNRFYFTTYVKYLKGQGAAINTINKKITSLKVYNDWLLSNGIVDGTYISIKRDKMKVASGSEDEVSVLNDEEVERFLFALEKENDREKALGYILLYTGLRVSEVINIELHDIDHLSAQPRVCGKEVRSGKCCRAQMYSKSCKHTEQKNEQFFNKSVPICESTGRKTS